MEDKILRFVESQTNPTLGEITNHLQADIRKHVERLIKAGKLFWYWDTTVGYNGEYRVVNDEELI